MINKFPHYRNIKEVHGFNEPLMDCEQVDNETTRMSEIIFAPDPETGVPRSDLAVIYSRSRSPEVANYINDVLLRGVPSTSSGVDDADIALDMAQRCTETETEYVRRLMKIASNKDDSQ